MILFLACYAIVMLLVGIIGAMRYSAKLERALHDIAMLDTERVICAASIAREALSP